MMLAAFPEWQAHIEVWLLVVALIALGLYASRVIQPKAVAAGEPPITGRQKGWFVFAVLVFWVATDFPMHDIAEQRLYSVHMIQHSLLMVVFPPAILLATPTWLARLIVGQGVFKRVVYYWSRPAPALIVNLGLTIFMHSAIAVNSSVANAWVHYGLHTLMVFSALAVWMCICGPIPELRVGPPLKILVIFLLSIIPTIPAAFLTTAEAILYQGYNTPERLWGIGVDTDQQLAGVIMKVITGSYLWVIIATIFFKWTLGERSEKAKYRGKLVPSAGSTSEDSDSDAPPGTISGDREPVPHA
jgi:putative membrane protein